MKALGVGETLSLPAPRLAGALSLEEAILRRRACREFETRPVRIEALSQLLWAAQGITDPQNALRAAPSAGARYPLRLRLFCREGVFLYLPEGHCLRKLSGQELRGQLAQASYGQEYVAACGAVLLFSGLYERTTSRFGARGRLYVTIDLGHAAQNVLLQAVSLGLGAVVIGAFEEDLLGQLCELPPEETPLYLIPVGYPRLPA